MNETIPEIIFYALKKNGLPEETAIALANSKIMEQAYRRIQKELGEELNQKLYEEAIKYIAAVARI